MNSKGYEKNSRENIQPDHRRERRISSIDFNNRVDAFLDAGYGKCLFRDKENRRLLVSVLSEKNNIEYVVEAYVIMPNHVHLLITIDQGDDIYDVMGRIKGKSSYLINKHLGTSGKLWMREMWDRAIRTDDHLQNVINYIKDNPRYLPPETFALYIRPGLTFVEEQ